MKEESVLTSASKNCLKKITKLLSEYRKPVQKVNIWLERSSFVKPVGSQLKHRL